MFMQGRIKLTLLIAIPIFSSCSTYRYIYSASPANTPYFTKKGESKLTGYYSGSSENRLTDKYAHGYDLQGAYALSDHSFNMPVGIKQVNNYTSYITVIGMEQL